MAPLVRYHSVIMSASCGHSSTAPCRIPDESGEVKWYPQEEKERKTYINRKTGRPLTEFQYAVYDLCAQIPAGSFATYGDLASVLGKGGQGARAVGNALRVNPFAPLPVPCHRVVLGSFFLGGYGGVMYTDEHAFCGKRKILQSEGVAIDGTGHIEAKDRAARRFTSFVLPSGAPAKEEPEDEKPPKAIEHVPADNLFSRFAHVPAKRLQSRARPVPAS